MTLFFRLVNYLSFYGLWLVCVFAGVAKKPLWAIPCVLCYLALHLFFIASFRKREAILILALTVVGALNESLLAMGGVVVYTGAYWEGISWWTLSLWACFATTYWHAFSWLESRPVLATLLGATAAPMCYAWIEQVGGMSFPKGYTEAFLVIGVLWAVVLPGSFAISHYVRNYRRGV